MTRPELHALVDIVMDARERTGRDLMIDIGKRITIWDTSYILLYTNTDFETFSDFTKAVQEYIKTLEK